MIIKMKGPSWQQTEEGKWCLISGKDRYWSSLVLLYKDYKTGRWKCYLNKTVFGEITDFDNYDLKSLDSLHQSMKQAEDFVRVRIPGF